MRISLISKLTIGISLILTGMLGILNLLTNSMRASDTIASQFVGANLAAEGIEVVKNIMDDLLVQSSDWTYVVNGIPDGTYEVDSLTRNFGIDVNDSTRARSIFTSTSTTPLTLDFTTREYGYSGDPNAIETMFRRTVYVKWNADPLTGEPISLSVSSRIDWTVRGNDLSVVVDDQFYRWRL